MLISGTVEVINKDNEIIAKINTGDFVGEMAFIEGYTRPHCTVTTKVRSPRRPLALLPPQDCDTPVTHVG